MFTQNPVILGKFGESHRLWQGIPGIEITAKGNMYFCWYSGETGEDIGNYALLFRGTENAAPVLIGAAVPEEKHRCFDPCLWIDPLGRLWFSWARYPDDGVFAVLCDDPDAEKPQFGVEFFVAHNVMMNKPTVLSTGEWVFPAAVWKHGDYPAGLPRLAYAAVTADQGKTFSLRGGVDAPDRCFDEHMFLERSDGVLAVYVRNYPGISMALSYDRGSHWSDCFDSGIPAPNTRFFIRRLRSGRILLINHLPDGNGATSRTRLTVFLSEDDGRTWPYFLMLDERRNVSYPDAAEAPDGSLYIIYDRERGDCDSYEAARAQAREILLAHITEEDILNGTVRSPGSFLKKTVSRLGDYDGDSGPLYEDFRARVRADAAARYMKETEPEAILARLFLKERIPCCLRNRIDCGKIDLLCERFRQNPDAGILAEIIREIRLGSAETDEDSLFGSILKLTDPCPDDKLTGTALAEAAGVSRCYLSWLILHKTGMDADLFCDVRRNRINKSFHTDSTEKR